MMPLHSKHWTLLLLAGAVATIVALSGPASIEASTRLTTPSTRVACGQGAQESGLEGYLKAMVVDTSSRGAVSRGMWKLPITSPSVVERVLVDSVCSAAISGYNSHLASTSTPLTNAFVFRVDTLYVVEPIWAPGSKHFKLIMVLGPLWQRVASIAA